MTDTRATTAGTPPFRSWAMLELMGHRQRHGFVEEVELAGTKMLRIDIPAEGGDVTEYYGGSSVYALRPCTEEVARAAAARYGDVRPVRPVEFRPALASPEMGGDADGFPG